MHQLRACPALTSADKQWRLKRHALTYSTALHRDRKRSRQRESYQLPDKPPPPDV
ncbi:hypothetical protein ElyMa_004084800, partial [Elysia marginata]